MLLQSKVKLEVMSDPTLLSIIASSIRAGLTFSTVHEAHSNNEMIEGYDPTKANKTLLAFDINSMYSTIMINYPMATGTYKFMTSLSDLSNLERKILRNELRKNDAFGFLVCVDLKYPASLHKVHNAFPILVERKQYNDSKVYKLVTSLQDKRFYTASAYLIQYAVQMGIVIEKIHFAISFRQSFFLSNYVKSLMTLRSKSTSSFKSNFFKLLGNIIYG